METVARPFRFRSVDHADGTFQTCGPQCVGGRPDRGTDEERVPADLVEEFLTLLGKAARTTLRSSGPPH